MPPKKNMKKMDLGAFLADESYGSWADEEVDMSSIGVPTSSSAAPMSSGYRPDFGAQDSGRADRTEYPVPDAPPYKARVANLPYDVEEDALLRFFEDRLQARDAVEDVKLPLDPMTSRPKGFAFVTFSERALLEEALNLTMSEFNGRKIFVNVAAPQKADVFDMDWRSARTGPVGGGRDRREPREDVELDWGAARNSSGPAPSRGPRGGDRDFGERRPRRDEPDLDWGAARSSAGLPPRERGDRPPRGGDREFADRKPRRDEPELDWGSARTGGPLPPKERDNFRRENAPKKEEADLDWTSARGSGLGPASGAGAASGANFRKKDDKEFDWKRGQALPPRSHSNKAKKDDKEKDQPKPQKSVYDVLSLEGEESDAEAETETKTETETEAKETGLEEKVSELSVNEGDWKTVGK